VTGAGEVLEVGGVICSNRVKDNRRTQKNAEKHKHSTEATVRK